MSFTEDADAYLNDFGVSVIWGEVSALGILDEPEDIVGEIAISASYSLLVKADTFDGIDTGDTITVDGTEYEVRTVRKIDDGLFARITLSDG